MKNNTNVVKISQADFNTILLHAEKISNGQFDFCAVLRKELSNKFGIKLKDSSPLIDSIWDAAKNPEVDVQNETRLFLAQFNLIITGEGVNYRLVKRSDNYCELEPIAENTAAIVPVDNSNAATTTPAISLE